MAVFRLRYQETDLELPQGDFVVGRSSACNLSLDDALVSRRHARFQIAPSIVTVEDLGSRNGVLVNGERIRAATIVRHLDRVTIGSKEMVVIELGAAERSSPPDADAMPCHVCGSAVGAMQSHCRQCGAPALRRAGTLAGTELDLRMTMEGGPLAGPDDVTRQSGRGFDLLARIANKGFALGRYEEAERILGRHLDALLEQATHGMIPDDGTLGQATDCALRLAKGLKSSRWVRWVFDVHAAARELPTTEQVDTLFDLVHEVGYRETLPLREYIAALREERKLLTPAERFILNRLDGLEKVVSAR